MRTRKTTGSIADDARAILEPVARLTAALVSYLDGDNITTAAAADIYAAEAVAKSLRRALTRSGATIAICTLIDTLPLTAADRQAVEKFMQLSRQR